MGEIPKDFDEEKFVNDLIRHQVSLASYNVLFTAKQADFLRQMCGAMGLAGAFDTVVEFWVADGAASVLPTGDIILNEKKDEPTMDDWRRRLNQ